MLCASWRSWLVIVIALLVVGALIALAFKLLWLALTGLVIGALARLVLPGRQQVGVVATALIAVAASLLGGIVRDAIGLGGIPSSSSRWLSLRSASRCSRQPTVVGPARGSRPVACGVTPVSLTPQLETATAV